MTAIMQQPEHLTKQQLAALRAENLRWFRSVSKQQPKQRKS